MVETLICVLMTAVFVIVIAGMILHDSMNERLSSHEAAVAEQIAGLKSASFLGAEFYEAEQQLRQEMQAAETERRQKEKQEEQAAPTAKGRPRGAKPAGSRSPNGRARTVDGEWR